MPSSLAVLPFSNATGDTQIEYLSDGLTENVLFGLSQLSEIEVVARSAVFRHKESDDDPLTIGRALGVDSVVTGRIRKRGPTLLITAEMIDVRSGLQLWGAQYKRSSVAIYDVEDEIANEISDKLRLKLSPEKQRVLNKRRTDNPDAYHLFLKARFYWGKRTEESLKKSLQLFRQAIEADPMYALAYAGLAEGYVPFAYWCHQSPKEAWPKARAAAEKALEIEPELPEALTVIGSVKAVYDWDIVGAEEVVRQAVRLDPKYPRARQTLSECLTVSGRFEESVEEIRKALDLDPLSLHTNAAVVMHNYYARRYTEAISQGRQAVELDPGFFPTRYYLGLSYQANGNHKEAVAELEQARALSGGATLMTATLATTLTSSGRDGEADKLLAELEEISAMRYVPQTPISAAYAAKGNIDEALSRLERGCDERCSMLPYALSCDVMFDRLRDQPRFQTLVQRVLPSRV
jgi:TolB-like protein/Flp pilus assembly protein TadD